MNSKLTWKKVREIRERYKNGELQKDLAKCYSISLVQVSYIVNNHCWIDINYRNMRIGRFRKVKKAKEKR